MTYEIESDIPMSKDGRGRPSFYPFRDMSVGDSFFASGVRINSVRRSASLFASRNGMKFATRKQTENGVTGLRVWRVK